MCSTCGCGNTDKITIRKVGEDSGDELNFGMLLPRESDHEHGHHHSHAHTHKHHHGHEEHNHGKTVVELEREILHENNLMAERVRGYLQAKSIFALNWMSSPGSGKTSLLERTLKDLNDRFRFYVIEGDQQTMQDAQRIDALHIPVVQVNTGKACHLDSEMVYRAIQKLDPDFESILMIENVGNLVCPAGFDLGEDERVVVISVTEGEDKPLKYPDMFETAGVCLINKIDLLPYVPFDVENMKTYARRIKPDMLFFEVSALTGEGMDQWYAWLASRFENKKKK